MFGYGGWLTGLDEHDYHQNVYRIMMVSMIWILWLSNQLICCVILLNFLISMMSEIYTQVIEDQFYVMCKMKNDLNKEYYHL
jgi:hypothetical protein